MTEVLVVDDSATDRAMVAGLLRAQTDWKIAVARDGEDALEQISNRQPDIIVTDLQMPEVDGLELVCRVKQEWPALPVILMTAQGSEDIAAEALRNGATSYIPKRSLAHNMVPVVQRVVFAVEESRAIQDVLHCMDRCDLEFTLPSDPALLPSLTNLLRRVARDFGVAKPGEDARIGMAIDEALLNAYLHGSLEVSAGLSEVDYEQYALLAEERAVQSPYCDRKIHTQVRVNDNEAMFVIRDEGPGFDVSRLPDPEAPMELGKPSGRGIVIMRTFMDDVRYNEAGNEVTLIKKCQVINT